ncbi:MAG: SAM-dependent methyltransferase, partial [Pseudomonadota bacterium]
QRLQEADVIFYDRARDEEILELARRDAKRVCLSQVQNESPWSQDWMAATLMKELKDGYKIVWLTSRTELAQDVTKRSGTEAEFVPGLSAATALQESARRAG